MSEADAIVRYYESYAGSFTGEMPLYDAICRGLRSHPALVSLLAEHPEPARQPNLLFAAAHDLVLAGVEHRLSDLYAELRSGAEVPSDTGAVEVFVDFVLSNRTAIDQRLATRTTQTNEVGRSALLALFARHAASRGIEALGWIDLGASAGLNLQFEEFRIDYATESGERTVGTPDSAVQLHCRVRSGEPPLCEPASIGWRIGVDRAPIDVDDAVQARWLDACLWPNQRERRERLHAAIAVARRHPPTMVRADASVGIDDALTQAPSELPVMVTTTWVWYYLPDATRQSVLEAFRRHPRPVYWYSLEGVGVVAPEHGQAAEVRDSALTLVAFDGGEPRVERLGEAHPHGTWVSWAHG